MRTHKRSGNINTNLFAAFVSRQIQIFQVQSVTWWGFASSESVTRARAKSVYMLQRAVMSTGIQVPLEPALGYCILSGPCQE